MKRSILGAIIAVDLAVIGGASFVLMNRLQSVDFPQTAAQKPASPRPDPLTVPATPAQPLPAPAAPAEIKRRILFKIKIPNAKKVQIMGDFTDWKPQNLSEDDKKFWTVTIPISPGVYSYNYVIDGQRKVKDPNNPRATPDRKSILTVKGNI